MHTYSLNNHEDLFWCILIIKYGILKANGLCFYLKMFSSVARTFQWKMTENWY